MLSVFENRVLRRIVWPKRDDVTWERRKLHNEDLNVLYTSPNSVRVKKPRRMVGWVRDLAPTPPHKLYPHSSVDITYRKVLHVQPEDGQH